MRRLIWRELRERSGWAVVLALSCVGVTLVLRRFTFVGGFSAATAWLWLPIATAFLFGLGAFSSEQAGSADFLYSRPVSWKKMLLAKVAAALVVIVGSVVLSAVVYRLIRPEQYAQFTTVPHLARGAAYTAALLMVAYLFGLAYSPPLPGVFGGIVTFIALMVALGLETSVYQALSNRGAADAAMVSVRWLCGWIAGSAAATVVLARFGMTLPTPARVLRYAVVVLVVVVPATGLMSVIPRNRTRIDFGMESRLSQTSFSPDGRYALVERTRLLDLLQTPASPATDVFLLRISDQKSAKLSYEGPLIVGLRAAWARSDAVVYRDPHGIRIARMEPNGSIVEKTVQVFPGSRGFFLPSADRRYALVLYQKGEIEKAAVVDVERAVRVGPILEDVKKRWWQSNTEVGYIDAAGKRHIVSVVK